MKKFFLTAIAVNTIFLSAHADTKVVSCAGPVGSGTKVSGSLELGPTEYGAQTVKGTLDATIKGKALKFNVIGQYDSIEGIEYMTLGAKNDDHLNAIYIHFADDENESLSFIEYKGVNYPLSCK